MSEWGRGGGGQLPREETSTRELFEQVGQDIRRAREGDRVAKADPRRPWRRFWVKRSS